MAAPQNPFKKALAEGKTQIGCWMTFGEASTAEIMGTAGFDWLVIDGEHTPNDIRSIRDQLMALDASPSHPVVRVPIGEPWIIKQVMDAGAQTVLVPMVESAEHAHEMVRAVTYPPRRRHLGARHPFRRGQRLCADGGSGGLPDRAGGKPRRHCRAGRYPGG